MIKIGSRMGGFSRSVSKFSGQKTHVFCLWRSSVPMAYPRYPVTQLQHFFSLKARRLSSTTDAWSMGDLDTHGTKFWCKAFTEVTGRFYRFLRTHTNVLTYSYFLSLTSFFRDFEAILLRLPLLFPPRASEEFSGLGHRRERQVTWDSFHGMVRGKF